MGPSLGIPGAATDVEMTIKTPQSPNRYLDDWLYYDGMYGSKITALWLGSESCRGVDGICMLYPGRNHVLNGHR